MNTGIQTNSHLSPILILLALKPMKFHWVSPDWHQNKCNENQKWWWAMLLSIVLLFHLNRGGRLNHRSSHSHSKGTSFKKNPYTQIWNFIKLNAFSAICIWSKALFHVVFKLIKSTNQWLVVKCLLNFLCTLSLCHVLWCLYGRIIKENHKD